MEMRRPTPMKVSFVLLERKGIFEMEWLFSSLGCVVFNEVVRLLPVDKVKKLSTSSPILQQNKLVFVPSKKIG